LDELHPGDEPLIVDAQQVDADAIGARRRLFRGRVGHRGPVGHQHVGLSIGHRRGRDRHDVAGGLHLAGADDRPERLGDALQLTAEVAGRALAQVGDPVVHMRRIDGREVDDLGAGHPDGVAPQRLPVLVSSDCDRLEEDHGQQRRDDHCGCPARDEKSRCSIGFRRGHRAAPALRWKFRPH